MTILVDQCRWPFRGRMWCHLVSDSSFDELHRFTQQLGIPRVAFQGDHYDLHESGREAAIAQGAQAVDSRVIIAGLKSAGLRRGPGLWSGGLAAIAHLETPALTTSRLLLRQWTSADLLSSNLDAISLPEWVHKDAALLAIRGFGRWAVEQVDTGELIGAVGLRGIDPLLPFPPALEIGARILPCHQRKGFSTEAVRAAIQYGFDTLQVTEVVAFIAQTNASARGTASYVGLEMSPDSNFEHPRYGNNDPNRLHDIWMIRDVRSTNGNAGE